MYGKFFAQTFTGSMFGAGANVFAVWGYVIANAVNGSVELNPAVVASCIGMKPAEVASAITYLAAPDSASRSHAEDGRRLVKEGAFLYRVVNHLTYRDTRSDSDRREYMRAYMKEYRKRDQDDENVKPPRKLTSSQLAQTDTETETKTGTAKEKSKAKKGPASRDLSYQEFLEACKAKGEKPLPADDPIFEYSKQIGLPIEFLRLAWREFVEAYSSEGKLQRGIKGWRQTFRRSVRRNWYRLWFQDERHDWALTTQGKQAQLAHQQAKANGQQETTGAHA